MVTLAQIQGPPSGPKLGQACRFVAQGQALSTIDYFLEHEGVFYPDPLPVEPDRSVRLYPEAPGRYRLHAAWSAPDGPIAWTFVEFNVPGPEGTAPLRVSVNGERLWAPTPWDASLLTTHERSVLRELRALIRPGATVYDAGANLGTFSVQFVQWIGAEGWLYAIEPNPVCVYFLRANLEATRRGNFTILPLALASRSGDCGFTLNYGSSLIGLGSDSATSGKPGHKIHVQARALDGLIATLHLRQPDFIKLDVEGAEAGAVAGMMQTIERRRPGLMIEMHGRDAATDTLRQLAHLSYQYLLCSTSVRYQSAEDLLGVLPDACVQVIGNPQM